MRKLRLIACVSLAVASAPAAAQMPVATPDDLGGAVRACADAMPDGSVDATALTRGGWAPASATREGKAVDVPVGIYGHAERKALILLPDPDKPNTICMTMARMDSVRSYSGMIQGISRAIGSEPFNRDGNTTYWRHGPLLIQLAATGSREQPGVRASVIAVPEEKK